jgi:SAM-dependent methyltransferase
MFYDTIARFYDAENEFFTADLPLYLEMAEEYGDPILDIGCGTGRVLLHLAQAGYQMVGVDPSVEMLALAKRKLQVLPDVAAQVKLIEVGILEYTAATPFPLILLPYNAFMHFRTPNEQLKVLQHLQKLLTPDGVIVIDLPNAGEAYASENDSGLVLERSFIEPQSGHLVMQQSVSEIDRIQQTLHITWIYDEITADRSLKRTVAPLVLRYVFAAELKLLLQLAHLHPIATYGDYERGALIDGCERLIVIAGQG